jgi:FixJ family two-component response regulator
MNRGRVSCRNIVPAAVIQVVVISSVHPSSVNAYQLREHLAQGEDVVTDDEHNRRIQLIAAKLGISEITVKAHRSNVMCKMQSQSLPGLVTMAESLGVRPRAR